MHRDIILSIDGMGGENAPLSVVEGMSLFVAQQPNIHFRVFGNQSRLGPLIKEFPSLENKCTIFHTDEYISDDEQPVRALKKYPNSSMTLCLEDLKNGNSSACVSSGNTGALMVIAKMRLGMIEGIKRPAIVSLFPNMKNGCVMLDLGANIDCEPVNLLQFTIMGLCFARVILNTPNPSVGILNVGTEDHKGRDLEKKTLELLSQRAKLNFHGFIEPYDICNGTVDVAVTDGFCGNLVIKTAESAAVTCKNFMKEAFSSSLLNKIAAYFLKSSLKKVFNKIDPNKNNGAMLIGLNGIVVKSHGSSNAEAFHNAINKAYLLVKQDINRQVRELLVDFEDIESGQSLVSIIKSKLGF
jgi:glycerol-3-phosphate acyltransferase PlsX